MGVAQGDRFTPFTPAGAGRIIDQRWPYDLQFRQSGSNPSNQIIDRLGATDPQVCALVSVNGNSGYNTDWFGTGKWSGATLGATVAGSPNGVQWNFHSMVMNARTLATRFGTDNYDLQGIEQLGAYRAIKIAAYFIGAPIAANVDNGLELCTAGGGLIDDGCICKSGTPGIGFRCSDVNTIQAIIRPTQAGPLSTIVLPTPVGFSHQDLHAYEIRVVGARGSQNAYAKWYIDGRLMLTRFWDTVPSMPTNSSVNFAGLKTFLISNGGSALGYAVKELLFHGATTEQNLL